MGGFAGPFHEARFGVVSAHAEEFRGRSGKQYAWGSLSGFQGEEAIMTFASASALLRGH
jgi:hypothetical protein